jgi:hypothetical protein
MSSSARLSGRYRTATTTNTRYRSKGPEEKTVAVSAGNLSRNEPQAAKNFLAINKASLTSKEPKERVTVNDANDAIA